MPATAVSPPPASPTSLVLAATGRWRACYDVAAVAPCDAPRRGAVAIRVRGGVVRRAEPASRGPLILEARSGGGEITCEVWAPADTPQAEIDAALDAAARWAGLRDRPGDLQAVVGGHPLLRRLLADVGEVRLGVLPRLEEAFGRAVLAQLVQAAEAHRSTAQVAACAGDPAPGRLWTWPTPAQIGATPAWTLRRCGVSLRSARALHAGALAMRRLREAFAGDRPDWTLLDRRLRTLPGVGVWTSAETRLALGDADAVSVGDYNLPSLVGAVLGGDAERGRGWTDEEMVALLAPFAGQRGRVARLCVLAIRRGAVRGPRRRAPRAPLSAHRYW